MTDTNYLYEYFLANSAESDTEADASKADTDRDED